MKFVLIENDQMGQTPREVVDIPEITESMYEYGEHEEILEAKAEKLNVFSTYYTYVSLDEAINVFNNFKEVLKDEL